MGWNEVTAGPDHLSFSQLSMWARCPKQWEYRYVKKMVRAPSSSLIVGSSVHTSIEHNYKNKFKTKKQANRNEVMDAFDTTFEERKHGCDFEGKHPADEKDRGYNMASVHYSDLAPTFQPLVKPEISFVLKVKGMKKKLIGYIDAYGIASGFGKKKALIVDNKTGKRSYKQFDTNMSPQLTWYAIAAREVLGWKAVAVAFDTMISLKSSAKTQRLIAPLPTKEREEALKGGAILIEKAMNAGLFYPTENPMTCSWCGYNDICPSAKAAKAATSF